MTYTLFRKGIPLIVILSFLTFPLVFAADNNVKKARGKVEIVDLKKKFFVVNESQYFWNYDTTFSDEKGTPVKIDQLKPNASVYIEWESVKGTWKRIPKRVCIFREIE
jgi:hypothetical protein